MPLVVKYSCVVCGLVRVPLDVPPRDLEDVVEWAEQTMALARADHARRAPKCPARNVSEFVVPLATPAARA